MVQLKVAEGEQQLRQTLDFNSSMVQLKATISASTLFQFLYGTIEGSNGKSEYLRGTSFQFLYGTIEGFKWCVNNPLIEYFNSSMVQLKDKGVQPNGCHATDFNSSMVQLKADSLDPKSDLYTISIPLWYN